MDILMLRTSEANFEKNLAIAESILGKVHVVEGERNMVSSFRKCAAASTTPLFVLVDADNVVNQNAIKELAVVTSPCIFFTNNRYGVSYGHGGIKVISRDSSFEGANADVTERLALNAVLEVISYHEFDYSMESHWRTVFRELIKLKLWGNVELFTHWMNHPTPRAIWENSAEPFCRRTSIRGLIDMNLNGSGLSELFDLEINRNDAYGEYLRTNL